MMAEVTQFAVFWGGMKTRIETKLGLSADAMHVHLSILILLFFALVTRKRLYHPLPWLLTLAVELCNEFIDMNQPVGSIESNWPASRHDIMNTMFLPTVLLVLLRLRNRTRWRPDPQDQSGG